MSPQELITKLEALEEAFATEIAPLSSEQEIRAAQARFLGKKGAVSELMKLMGRLAPDERRSVGQVANRVKAAVTDEVTRKLGELEEAARAADLARSVDVSLPGRPRPRGHVHLLSQVRDELVGIFGELGFDVAVGPQVETDWHNFEALGTGKDHPARDMQDTFYISEETVLRTQTSPVQIRTMLASDPPLKIVAPGVVYRRDDDATHSPVFMQLEGLLVDRGVRFSDLKGVLLHGVRRFFRRELDIRLRPSYFPFVEPGAEVDMQCSFCLSGDRRCRVCKGTGWVEIGGAGMVDPVVFEHVAYEPETWTGFAFGMGIDRMAMLRHAVSDIKLLYDGDLRFLRQF